MNARVLNRRLILWDPMPLPQVLAFYLGIPLLMAAMFGLNHAGLGRHFTIAQGIPYWAGIWVPFWLLLDAASRGSALALRPWSPPLWLVLLIGAVLAAWSSRPYIAWYVSQFRDWLPDGAPSRVPALPGSWRQLDQLLGFAGLPLFWIAINYYYDRILGVPRYRGRLLELNPAAAFETGAAVPDTIVRPEADRSPPVPPSSPPLSAPLSTNTELAAPHRSPPGPTGIDSDDNRVLGSALVALLPSKAGTDILALQAEDHYVRVYTSLGSALVRYRFGDAIRDLEALDGQQVHRSFWVRKSAVERLDTTANPWLITLRGGQQVPVSQAFRTAVRSARLAPG